MIRKVFAVAALVAAGYFAYHYLASRSPAVEAYEEFADALALEDMETARELTVASSKARRQLAQLSKRKTYGGTYGIDGTRYTLLSEAASSDGEVDLELEQEVRLNLAGDGYLHRYRHVAKLRETEEGWRVISFNRKKLDS